jgi:hypothetical protein
MKQVLSAVFAAAVVSSFAADRFVSASGIWKKPGIEGECYSDLQTALNAVKAGDTVWLQDGFVCDSGNAGSISGYGYARVKLPNAAFTLRSESGRVDEAGGKGACIRGIKDPDSSYDDGRGANAIRPVWSQNKESIIQGLVLEGGSTGDSPNYGAGCGVYGAVTLTNCIVRNNSAYCGGAVAGNSVRVCNSVISNNYAFGTGYGGGAAYCATCFYNCLIENNGAAKTAGAVFYNNSPGGAVPVYSNCVFKSNYALYGGACWFSKTDLTAVRAEFYDCQLLDNLASSGNAGAVCGLSRFVNCTITGNIASDASNHLFGRCGGVGVLDSNPVIAQMSILEHCIISNNFSTGAGGGAYGVIARDCTFTGNVAGSNGGGANRSYLTNCRLVDNVVSNYFTSTNGEDGNGGGIDRSYATNCFIAGNAAWAINRVASGNGGGASLSYLSNCVISNNWAVYRGAAVFNPGAPYTCYNCLIVGNRSAAPHVGYDRGMIIEGEWANTPAADPPKFYNCTIAGNYAPNYACINDAELYNCIVWDNDVPTELFANQVWCYNTCQKDQTVSENGNVNGNPNLAADYSLAKSKPCADAGQVLDWMAAADDPRAKDLAGHDRIIGSAPDMGCFERSRVGFIMSVW